jgi:hypothetical protein
MRTGSDLSFAMHKQGHRDDTDEEQVLSPDSIFFTAQWRISAQRQEFEQLCEIASHITRQKEQNEQDSDQPPGSAVTSA